MTTPLDAAKAFLAEDFDPITKKELEAIVEKAAAGDEKANKELQDRFSAPLTFGTAGLRGRVEAGVARMNRVVVAKRDPQQNLCVVLVLGQGAPNPFNLTLPQGWGMEYAFAMPAMSDCRLRFPPSSSPEAAVGSGTVALPPTPTPTVDIDVTLTFPPTDADFSGSERLMATGVVAPLGCP